MKSSGVLVSKEALRSNFKLTFENERGELHVILHQSKKIIFNNLKAGNEYYFFYFKGKSNFYFVKPQSMGEKTKQNEQKGLIMAKLAAEMKLKELTCEAINERINQVKNTTQNNLTIAKLEWLKEKLDRRHFNLLTRKEKKTRKDVEKLKYLFLSDYVYKGN